MQQSLDAGYHGSVQTRRGLIRNNLLDSPDLFIPSQSVSRSPSSSDPYNVASPALRLTTPNPHSGCGCIIQHDIMVTENITLFLTGVLQSHCICD